MSDDLYERLETKRNALIAARDAALEAYRRSVAAGHRAEIDRCEEGLRTAVEAHDDFVQRVLRAAAGGPK